MTIKKRHDQITDPESLSQSARKRLKRSMKRKRERAGKSKKWSMHNIIWAAIGLIALLYIPYIIISTEVLNYLIKRNGVCVKGVITTQTRHIRYSKPNYLYKITLNGEAYTGNSFYTDESKVGDSICVLYLKSIPSKNKPVNFFDPDEQLNCNCK